MSVFVKAQDIKTASISTACFLSNSICSSNLFSELTISFLLEGWNDIIFRGSFNNYVDKMRGEGGKKCLFFVEV